MGKHGPCRHCGVTSTPLWRNGPPEKPVLCNACGSRWRTKGTLTNYTPLHARESLDMEEPEVSKMKSISFKPKEQKLKRKHINGFVKIEHEMENCDQIFRKVLKEDTSNRSSAGSAISYSESCANFGTRDASDLTGSPQSSVWDSLVPSRKRTCFTRPKPSHVEKLTQDLYSILHEQQSSYLSGSSEEDLLYESDALMGSVEMDHGGVLIRHPNSTTVEEESEASSLPVDNRSHIMNEAYSGSASFSVHTEREGTHFSNVGSENLKKSTAQVVQMHVKRDKFSREKLHILRDRDSPLGFIDLKDVASFEEFMRHLTHEEQQQLMKYLPSTDTAKPPESLKSMFTSPQFVETLSFFQQLLLEGIFDLSFSGANAEECMNLKRLLLINLNKSRWVEQYRQLKDMRCKQISGKEVATGSNILGHSNLTSYKRPRDGQNQNFQELKGVMRSPRRVCRIVDMNIPTVRSSQLNSSDAGTKLIYGADDFIDNDGVCFSPRSLFASPPHRSSMMVPLQFNYDSSDQDVLLDMPSNSSFPEAELLYNPLKQNTVPSSSLAKSRVGEREESLSNNLSSSFSIKHLRQW